MAMPCVNTFSVKAAEYWADMYWLLSLASLRYHNLLIMFCACNSFLSCSNDGMDALRMPFGLANLQV